MHRRTRRNVALSALLLSVAPRALAGDEPFERGEVVVDGRRFPYRLLAPEHVEEGRLYPLVLFLHGSGERGEDNELQLVHFPERMVEAARRERFPCYLLAPQCPEGTRWVEADFGGAPHAFQAEPTPALAAAEAALLQVARTRPVDPERVLLTGLSMGGFGAWDMAQRHPDWFAAVAPICGGTDVHAVARLAGLPLSVWHGAEDPTVPVRLTDEAVAALRALNLPVELHRLEGVQHDSWVQAYGDEGCLDWLFGARRDPRAALDASAHLLGAAIAPDERVAFLGDSITQAGAEPNGYVDLLRRALRERNPAAAVIPAGISGHRVPDLLARFQRDVVEQDATLVFVYIGINDVWHSLRGKGTPQDEYEAGLRRLVRELRASGATVVLATPSVIGEKPRGENELDALLDAYADVSRTVAREEGATLCDLRRAFVDHLRLFGPRDGADRGVLTRDGVHLTPAGEVFVATQAARSLREAALAR